MVDRFHHIWFLKTFGMSWYQGLCPSHPGNVLASKKFFGGKDNKELSDENPTYLTPDGKTFAVWGMIYLLEMVPDLQKTIDIQQAKVYLFKQVVDLRSNPHFFCVFSGWQWFVHLN